MAIRVKALSTHKVDVKYHFTDGTRLIHDSGRYYIESKDPTNEVLVDKTKFTNGGNENVSYKYRNRGSEPATTIEDTEYYTHPYGGRTAKPRTGVPRLGWSITDGRTTTYGAGMATSDYTAAQRGLGRGETISRSAATAKIDLVNPKWTEWDSKGTSGTTFSKEPERTKAFIRKETKAGRLE